jgi:hypothetical protein
MMERAFQAELHRISLGECDEGKVEAYQNDLNGCGRGDDRRGDYLCVER